MYSNDQEVLTVISCCVFYVAILNWICTQHWRCIRRKPLQLAGKNFSSSHCLFKCVFFYQPSITLTLRQEYSNQNEGKNWNFPKMHTHQHLFDDIEMKGVTLNYNTKPNEKLHGPLKESYRRRTNFKDVANQVGFLTCTIVLYTLSLQSCRF